MGDFNVDYSSKKNHLHHKLKEFASNHSLTQIVNKPTRVTENSSTTIDLIFVNNSHRIVQSDVLDASISDHRVVFVPSKGVSKNYCPRCLSIAVSKTMIKMHFGKT